MFSPPLILAHAFGARYDIPVPLYLFVLGGAGVVFISFLLVVRREVAPADVPATGDGSYVPDNKPVVGALGLLITAFLIYAGIYGSQEIPENILPTSFWLVIWIAVPMSCGVFGDWTPWINPFATIARAVDRDRLRKAVIGGPALRWPAWLGFWPATLLFFLIAGGELIYNGWATKPIVTAVALVVYALISAVGSLVFGAEEWLKRGEVFSVLWATWGRLGYFRFGRPGRTGFLGGVDQPFDDSVSRITFVFLMLMSVTFDGLLAIPAWKRFEGQLPHGFTVGSAGYITVAIVAFAVLVGLAWTVFGLFARGVRDVGHLDLSVRGTIAQLLPSLLPISFGYLVAHNLNYLLVNGQLLIPLVGNPTGTHQWLPAPFNDSYVVHKQPLPPGAYWYIDLILIVVVHIAAVFIAHRHLAGVARTRGQAERSEWPWIFAMVAYTMTSLFLLAQPIVKEGGSSSKTAAAVPAAHVASAPVASEPRGVPPPG
jgi:hypothetical protein